MFFLSFFGVFFPVNGKYMCGDHVTEQQIYSDGSLDGPECNAAPGRVTLRAPALV